MPWNFFQSLIRLFSDHCNVDLSHDRVHAFPSWGLYPAQSKMVREEYFPTITQVNKKDVQALMKINAGFRSFMEALVKHKLTLGLVNTKTPIMQAVNTLSMCLKQRGGGFKIPQEIKDYFINVV